MIFINFLQTFYLDNAALLERQFVVCCRSEGKLRDGFHLQFRSNTLTTTFTSCPNIMVECKATVLRSFPYMEDVGPKWRRPSPMPASRVLNSQKSQKLAIWQVRSNWARTMALKVEIEITDDSEYVLRPHCQFHCVVHILRSKLIRNSRKLMHEIKSFQETKIESQFKMP